MRERLGSWRRRVAGSLRQDRFLRRLAVLSSGTIVGQAVVVISSPLLTRLYTPEQFGLLGVFIALCGLLGTTMALRLELAVPVCDDDESAAAVVAAAMLASTALAALIGLGAWVAYAWLAEDGTATPGLGATLVCLPLALLFWGWSLPLSFWSIRRGTFRTNAFGKALQLVTQAVGQVGLGLGGLGVLGLVGGSTLGHAVRFGHFIRCLPTADRTVLRGVGLGAIATTFRRFWHYPAFSGPSALLQSAAQSLPALLLAVLYGPAVAGWFTLAQRMLELPVGLISGSASDVYQGELRGLDAAGIRRLFLRTALRFLVLGLAGMVPVLLFGPPLFALAFGEDWRISGVMVQCLVPVQLARFVVVPIMQSLNIFRRQELHLVSAGANLAALGLSFGAGWLWELGPLATLLLFSLGSCLAYLIYFLMAWQVVRNAALAGRDPWPDGRAGG